MSTAAPCLPQRDAQPRVAVLVPCLNEERTIGKVIADFRAALPEATVYVFDNNSTDRTAEVAAEAGAVVMREKRAGKGFVVQTMFRKINADVYVLVDGDDTYDAAQVHQLIAPVVDEQADMVVGTRLSAFSSGSFRQFHLLGNRLLTGFVNRLFGARLTDMLSGYRVMHRDLVKAVPILSGGFEVETELTLRALERDFIITEVPLRYQSRPAGSSSKLRTFRDGLRVIVSILDITRSYKPFTFFGLIALGFFAVGLAAGWVVIVDFIVDRYVEHVPLAILATGCMISGFLAVGIGILLNTINARLKELAYIVAGRQRGGHA